MHKELLFNARFKYKWRCLANEFVHAMLVLLYLLTKAHDWLLKKIAETEEKNPHINFRSLFSLENALKSQSNATYMVFLWSNLSESSGFTFRFQQGENVAFTDRSFHVTDDLTILFSDEFNFHLCTLSLGSCTAQNFDDTSQNNWFIHVYLLKIWGFCSERKFHVSVQSDCANGKEISWVRSHAYWQTALVRNAWLQFILLTNGVKKQANSSEHSSRSAQ